MAPQSRHDHGPLGAAEKTFVWSRNSKYRFFLDSQCVRVPRLGDVVTFLFLFQMALPRRFVVPMTLRFCMRCSGRCDRHASLLVHCQLLVQTIATNCQSAHVTQGRSQASDLLFVLFSSGMCFDIAWNGMVCYAMLPKWMIWCVGASCGLLDCSMM